MAADKLRDLSQPIDVPLLDATVAAFYGTGSKEQRTAADQILRELQNNPDMWLQVMHILQNTQNLNTKFFALQVLEGVIKYRWNALPVEQRDGMKNFISDVIVQLSGNEASFRTERLYVNKLNIILVQILKHEWPARWRNFIPDLVSAAKTSETICENCMAILKLLSEEVFDFSRGEMTQQKIKELKQSLNSEFQLIHELCLYVLSVSQRTELIRATLSTLHAFLSWIPLGYIFESPLLETLLKFFPIPAYRNLTLQCLTEVASLQFGNFYDAQYVKMYNIFMVQLQSILPPTTNIPEAYAHGSTEEQAFIQNLALFFTSFYKVHIRILESTQENISALLLGLEYLINISYVDDTEVFKVCLDYWNALVSELFEPQRSLENPAANMMGFQGSVMPPGMVDGLGSQLLQRRQLYAGPMSKLRMLMICRMAKPEEVLIVEDENGNIVRETMKDNDVLVQYKFIVLLLDSMGTEFETIEGRITSMLSHLQSEYGILERLVYKNKNQHRRCSYFQHLLKVRRDLKLLQLANLEELVTSCFFVIKGDRPKQKIHLLESLKRRKCNDERHNFLERLLGSARLLAEMVEPILKAATEISVLFARSFFMGLSVTIMALLARLRVLVQQILLDVVYLFNMVSSLSRNKQSVKITHERIEVFREFYPVSDDYVTLECVWKSDKYILHERKHKRESESRGEDSGGNLCVQASSVNYNTIESILGDDQLVPEKGEVDAALKEDPPHVKDMNIDLVNTDLLTSLSKFDDVKETVFSSEEGGQNHCAAKVSFCESSPEGGSHALPQSSTSGKFYSSSKKVAFVSIKNPTLVPESVQSSISVLTSNAKAKPFHFIGNESAQTKDDKTDSLASILTNVNAKDSIF